RDKIWPIETAYLYSDANPASISDPSGFAFWWPTFPTSGVSFDPGYWNSQGIQPVNNCTNYAYNRPCTKFYNPGNTFNLYNPDGTLSCHKIISGALRDGLVWPNPHKYKTGCAPGWHKVCVYVSNTIGDYHWYRQDDTGYWSDKPGNTPAVNCYPRTNVPITDPGRDAADRSYTKKCGCLCAPNKWW